MPIDFFDDAEDDLLFEEIGDTLEKGKRLGILDEEEEP